MDAAVAAQCLYCCCNAVSYAHWYSWLPSCFCMLITWLTSLFRMGIHRCWSSTRRSAGQCQFVSQGVVSLGSCFALHPFVCHQLAGSGKFRRLGIGNNLTARAPSFMLRLAPVRRPISLISPNTGNKFGYCLTAVLQINVPDPLGRLRPLY